MHPFYEDVCEEKEVKWGDYFKMVCDRFPDRNHEIVYKSLGCNKVDVLQKVALDLFIEGECDSELADITRKHLTILEKDGIHGFKI